MSKRLSRKMTAPEDTERLIAIIAIGLKPHARATIAEANKRGYLAESEVSGLVPDEKARDPQALAKAVEDVRKCLGKIRVAIVPDSMRPSLLRTSEGCGKKAVDLFASKVERLLLAETKKERMAEWRQYYRANPYGIFAREIGRYNLLADDEVKALCERIGGPDGWKARNTLVEHNLRLAVKHAWRFIRTEPARRSGLELMDLVQEGVTGIIKAAEFFKPELGFKFSTFAWWWVAQRIRRAIENEPSPVRIPVYQKTRWHGIQKEIASFHRRFGYEPSVEELGAIVGMQPETVREELRKMHATPGYGQVVRRLDAPISELSDTDMHELTPDRLNLNPEQVAIARNELEAARKGIQLMAKLAMLVNNRNGEIFAMRYGLRDGFELQTLDAVGKQFGRSRERIRQILDLEVWPAITRMGFRKNEEWFLRELERIKLLERLAGRRANL